ncbi:hypothetical protein ABZ897_05675 [Nonomuraea sp. NPDC046802]|uniref:hypothetical protein n=1 Tax=Nonomuraea sp. NPDC046802 TaxID=3154919 RepID=UPI0033FFE891
MSYSPQEPEDPGRAGAQGPASGPTRGTRPGVLIAWILALVLLGGGGAGAVALLSSDDEGSKGGDRGHGQGRDR